MLAENVVVKFGAGMQAFYHYGGLRLDWWRDNYPERAHTVATAEEAMRNAEREEDEALQRLVEVRVQKLEG